MFFQKSRKRKMFSFANVIILASCLLLSLFVLASSSSSTSPVTSATATATTPVTMQVGNFDFRLGSNPGFLTVRASTHTTSSFGAVCSYGLDPVVSGFSTEQELNHSQSTADLFCGYAFNFWTPNATHTNFFSSGDSIDLGAPPFPFMRNIACGNKVVCDNSDVQLSDFTDPTIAVAQQRSLFSKCSFEYFEYSYRSSIGGSGGSVPPLKCYQDKYLQLNCMLPRANAPDLTPSPPTATADPIQSTSTIQSPTTFVDDFVNPVSSTENPIYYAAGIKSGSTWKVRINSNFYNRLEVSQDNGASWGLSASWYRNDTARLLCHQFFNFTSKNAWFAQLPPNSKTSGMSFAWYAAPSCDGCMKLGNLDACTVRPTPADTPSDYFSSGDEIGLYCNDQPKDKPLVKEADLSTLPTTISGNFEYKHDAGNGGALYARPVVVGAATNPFTFGLVSATAVSEITAGTLCSWLGYNGGGIARSQEDILANYVESMPRIGVQPCWVSSMLCYSSFAKTADDCSFATNQANMCGGLDGSLFLECHLANATNPNGNNNTNKHIVISNSDSSVVTSIAIACGVLVAVVLITLVVTCCCFRRRVLLNVLTKMGGYSEDNVEIIAGNRNNGAPPQPFSTVRNNNNNNNNNAGLHSPRNNDDEGEQAHHNNNNNVVEEMHPVSNNNHRQIIASSNNHGVGETSNSSSSSSATVNRHANNTRLVLESLGLPKHLGDNNTTTVLFPFPKVAGVETRNNSNNDGEASPDAHKPSSHKQHDLMASSSSASMGESMRAGSTTILISPHSTNSETPFNGNNSNINKKNNNKASRDDDDDDLYDLGSPASTHNLVIQPKVQQQRQSPSKKQQQTTNKTKDGNVDLFSTFDEKTQNEKRDSNYRTERKPNNNNKDGEFSDADTE